MASGLYVINVDSESVFRESFSIGFPFVVPHGLNHFYLFLFKLFFERIETKNNINNGFYVRN